MLEQILIFSDQKDFNISIQISKFSKVLMKILSFVIRKAVTTLLVIS